MANVAPGTSVEASAPVAAIEARDLLADLDQVLGDDRVKLRDAVGLLRKLAPAWSRYERMTAKQLAADLRAEGVRTVNSSGTPWIDPGLRHVMADRDGPVCDGVRPPAVRSPDTSEFFYMLRITTSHALSWKSDVVMSVMR